MQFPLVALAAVSALTRSVAALITADFGVDPNTLHYGHISIGTASA